MGASENLRAERFEDSPQLSRAKELFMDECRYCGWKLDFCNESEIVCPWCGAADCWPTIEDLLDFDLEDFDPYLIWENMEDSFDDDTS